MHELAMDSIYLSDEVPPNQTQPFIEQTDSQEPAPSRPRVLVVDDEKLIADTITEILEGAGFLVAAAYDGWTAFEAAGRFQPDYLLSDVLMPRMNGVELAIAIRKMYPAVRIFLFSGQAGIGEILRGGQSQGFQFDLIPKPIHPLRLIERLKDM